jgi:hypothetical protein
MTGEFALVTAFQVQKCRQMWPDCRLRPHHLAPQNHFRQPIETDSLR